MFVRQSFILVGVIRVVFCHSIGAVRFVRRVVDKPALFRESLPQTVDGLGDMRLIQGVSRLFFRRIVSPCSQTFRPCGVAAALVEGVPERSVQRSKP